MWFIDGSFRQRVKGAKVLLGFLDSDAKVYFKAVIVSQRRVALTFFVRIFKPLKNNCDTDTYDMFLV